MGLTDSSLVIILTLLALITFTITILIWPKFARKSIFNIFKRIIILSITQFLILASIGVALNNYSGFYDSWSELLGVNDVPSNVNANLKNINSTNSIRFSDIAKARLSQNGSAIINRNIYGNKSNEIGMAWIVLPASAVTKIKLGNSDLSNYRVIQFLPGFPGTPNIWFKRLDILNKLEIAQKSKKLPPVIGVFTETNLRNGFDGECLDTPGGPYIETWLTSDVHTYMEKWLNLSQKRWGIVGISAGGWCAAMISIRHPEQFMSGGSIAGYFTPEPSKSLPQKVRVELLKEYDLRRIVIKNQPDTSIIATLSPSDHGSYFQTLHFVNDLKNSLKIKTLYLKHQGHNFTAWLPAITPILNWFGGEFNKK